MLRCVSVTGMVKWARPLVLIMRISVRAAIGAIGVDGYLDDWGSLLSRFPACSQNKIDIPNPSGYRDANITQAGTYWLGIFIKYQENVMTSNISKFILSAASVTAVAFISVAGSVPALG